VKKSQKRTAAVRCLFAVDEYQYSGREGKNAEIEEGRGMYRRRYIWGGRGKKVNV
jgi:hypothetical protein